MKRGLAVGMSLLFVSGILTACGEETVVQEPTPKIEVTEVTADETGLLQKQKYSPHTKA